MPKETDLADLEHRLLGWPGKARVLVAIAGAPGAGKNPPLRAPWWGGWIAATQ